MNAIITRKEYMANHAESTHAYYAQFVTSETKQYLLNFFPVTELRDALAAGNSMNSIPLERWDAATFVELPRVRFVPGNKFRSLLPLNRTAVTHAGDYVTQAGLTSIAKAAARIIVEEAN